MDGAKVIVSPCELIRVCLGVFYKGKRLHGALQVTIRPPDFLNVPVLPKLSKSKLMFGLCSSCMDERREPPCPHEDSDRDLVDVWTTVEICYAISCGYKVIRVWEAFYYTTLSPIFRTFYTKLARIKLESEGWPTHAATEEEKAAYIKDVNKRMPGLGLKAENIEKNEADQEAKREEILAHEAVVDAVRKRLSAVKAGDYNEGN